MVPWRWCRWRGWCWTQKEKTIDPVTQRIKHHDFSRTHMTCVQVQLSLHDLWKTLNYAGLSFITCSMRLDEICYAHLLLHSLILFYELQLSSVYMPTMCMSWILTFTPCHLREREEQDKHVSFCPVTHKAKPSKYSKCFLWLKFKMQIWQCQEQRGKIGECCYIVFHWSSHFQKCENQSGDQCYLYF